MASQLGRVQGPERQEVLDAVMDRSDVSALIRHLALQNASRFGGRTSPSVVSGHLIARRPDLSSSIKEVMPLVARICDEVNSMTLEQIRAELEHLGEAPPVVTQRPPPAELELPPNPGLPGHVLRFAPNPDGPLTLGNARPALLCDFFSKKYDGKLILRFEDTSPSVKPPLPEAYDWIVEDLAWLGINTDETYYQSDRLELYYARAEQLMALGGAYVCLCDREGFKSSAMRKEACPHRVQTPDQNARLWSDMMSGKLKAGRSVVRVKTDMSHPNPAIRDWPALRIDDAPHPRVGSRYRVWPLYNWSAAVDDHEMGITHIIRAKEHLTNEIRQSYVFKHFDWKLPTTVTIGRVKLEGSMLSKSRIMAGLRDGSYLGVDDPRVGTLRSLRRRGILPEVIRDAILDLGAKPVEATLKWDNLYSANRTKVDRFTRRFFFVPHPVTLIVTGVPAIDRVTVPNHPDNRKLGERVIQVQARGGKVLLWISSDDLSDLSSGDPIRLMGLFNVRLDKKEKAEATADFVSVPASVSSESHKKVIQWVPEHSAVPTEILMPDAAWIQGVSEPELSRQTEGDLVQLIRFGFAKLERIRESKVSAVFAHR